MSDHCPTSTFSKNASPPARAMSSSVDSPPSRGTVATSARTTLAPSPAKVMAIARPIPELAPVTTATVPASSLDMTEAYTIQLDMELATTLFEQLDRAARRGRGIVRDTYGAGEQAAHDIMRAAALRIGLEISVDAIGNLTMTLPGKDRHAPRIVIGSHLDSVP